MFKIDIKDERCARRLEGLKFAVNYSNTGYDNKRLTLDDFSSSALADISLLAKCTMTGIDGFDELTFAGEGIVPCKVTFNAFYTLGDLFNHCYTIVASELLKHYKCDDVTDDFIKASLKDVTTELWNDMLQFKKSFFVFRFITPFGRSVKAYQYQKPWSVSSIIQSVNYAIRGGADWEKLLEPTICKFINELTYLDFYEYLNGDVNDLSSFFRSKTYADVLAYFIEMEKKSKEGSCNE